MLIQQLNSSFDRDNDQLENYKCLRFDLNDSQAKFILYRKYQIWKYLRAFSIDNYEIKELYKEVKRFSSKSELDLWCSINNVEYQIVNELNIIEEKENN